MVISIAFIGLQHIFDQALQVHWSKAKTTKLVHFLVVWNHEDCPASLRDALRTRFVTFYGPFPCPYGPRLKGPSRCTSKGKGLSNDPLVSQTRCGQYLWPFVALVVTQGLKDQACLYLWPKSLDVVFKLWKSMLKSKWPDARVNDYSHIKKSAPVVTHSTQGHFNLHGSTLMSSWIIQVKCVWNYLSVPKSPRLHRWSLEMDLRSYLTLDHRCNYLSVMKYTSGRVNKLVSVGRNKNGWFTWPLKKTLTRQYVTSMHLSDEK